MPDDNSEAVARSRALWNDLVHSIAPQELVNDSVRYHTYYGDAIATLPPSSYHITDNTSNYPINSGFSSITVDLEDIRDLKRTVARLQTEVISLREKLECRETQANQKEHRKLEVP